MQNTRGITQPPPYIYHATVCFHFLSNATHQQIHFLKAQLKKKTKIHGKGI